MEKRYLVIKDKELRIEVKGFSFNLDLYDWVKDVKAPMLFADFCRVNSLEEDKFFWEIVK